MNNPYSRWNEVSKNGNGDGDRGGAPSSRGDDRGGGLHEHPRRAEDKGGGAHAHNNGGERGGGRRGIDGERGERDNRRGHDGDRGGDRNGGDRGPRRNGGSSRDRDRGDRGGRDGDRGDRGARRGDSRDRRPRSPRLSREEREKKDREEREKRRVDRENERLEKMRKEQEAAKAKRQKKLEAVLAMGVDPATAELAVDDPRFDISMYKAAGSGDAAAQETQAVYEVTVHKKEDNTFVALLIHADGTQKVRIEGPTRGSHDEALADSQHLRATYEQGGEQAGNLVVFQLSQRWWQPHELEQARTNERIRKIHYAMQCGLDETQATTLIDGDPNLNVEKWAEERCKQPEVPVNMPESGGKVARSGSRWVAQFTCYVPFEKSFKTEKIYAPKRDEAAQSNLDLAALKAAFAQGGLEAVLEEEKRLNDRDHTWSKQEMREHCKDLKDCGKETSAKLEDLPPLESTTINDEEMPITISGPYVGQAMLTWEEGVENGWISRHVADVLVEKELVTPTPIQQRTASLIAAGYDLLAAAQTGSGKTIAFLAPILKKIVHVDRPHVSGVSSFASPLAIFLSPTRELAQQTHRWLDDLSPFKTLCLFGGEAFNTQTAPISENQMDCICATPGRLLDCLDYGKVCCGAVQVVVLDEADQMLSAQGGLDNTVQEILRGRDMPDKRQTILFSATFPEGFELSCRHMLRKDNHCIIHVGNYGEGQGGSTDRIKQHFILAEKQTRWGRLVQDINTHWHSGKVIIFANKIVDAPTIINVLWQSNINAYHLHGKMNQYERQGVIKSFEDGEFDVLVCTNLGSRGLDFPDIDLVVQLELPASLEVYTHRIGRTARQNRQGISLSYFGDKDKPMARPLRDFLIKLNQEIPPWLERYAGPRVQSEK